ncbi:elongation factor G [Candidatus Dojkabacteria bacterium]|uniref:Elongation factor G n=1 Tax=Candidatus Dojkabacteria bacterium TaxID=2099670 RepID=A0A955L3S2_9BACT|nr:elongation factor G [Candidatus Dojkabacteria bacterium]
MSDKQDTPIEKFDLSKIRNIGIIAHIDAGKTTVTERILYYTGKKHKVGEVHHGEAEMDWMEQEQERGITIQSAATTCFWSVGDTKYRINIIDTPGHVDFTAEVERSLRVLDGGVVIFDGKMGVEPQSETVWRQADKYSVPRMCFINKLDAIGGDFYKSLESIQQRLNKKAIAIQLPIGESKEFTGIIDLVARKAVIYKDEMGNEREVTDIPDEYKDKVEEYRAVLIEKAVEFDDDVMDRYLNGEEPTEDELYMCIRKGTLDLGIFPVLAGAALANKGVQTMLDCVIRYLPSPEDVPPVVGEDVNTGEDIERKALDEEPFCALAFKIMVDPHVGTLAFCRVYSGTLEAGSYVYNPGKNSKERVGRILMMHANHREEIKSIRTGDIAAILGLKSTVTGDTVCDENHPILLEGISFADPVVTVAIEPKTKSDQEKMGTVLAKLIQEDPTFKVESDTETGQTKISGMGELHLEVKVDIMKRDYGIEANVGKPQVAYKETVLSSAKDVEVKYIRQSGGRGQYGHVVINIEPNERGKGFEFINEIKGGSIPREYIPAVQKGMEKSMASGILGGYPVVDIIVHLTDGSYHEVDSSEQAFQIAGSMALKDGMKLANPTLLEPIMKVEVIVPDEFSGDVTGALSSKRGQILGMEAAEGSIQKISANVPLAEMFGWIQELRSMTSGRGVSTMEFGHYEAVPKNVQEEVLGSKAK